MIKFQGYYITVNWSKTKLVEFLRFGNDEILSSIEETNDGNSPKHFPVLTFLVCNNKRAKTDKLQDSFEGHKYMDKNVVCDFQLNVHQKHNSSIHTHRQKHK